MNKLFTISESTERVKSCGTTGPSIQESHDCLCPFLKQTHDCEVLGSDSAFADVTGLVCCLCVLRGGQKLARDGKQ